MATNEDTYEGWTNRETWAVALWINNEQGWQTDVHDVIRTEQDSINSRGALGEVFDARSCGELVKDNVEAVLSGDEYDNLHEAHKISQDVGSLWRVNWDELGAAFLADVNSTDAL